MDNRGKLAALIAALWAGQSIGGNLIAAPAKFQAPSLALPTAMEIGRATFRAEGYAEYALAAALVLAWFASRSRQGLALLGAALLAFAVQRLWLLPILDVRAGVIIAGGSVTPSIHHLVYVGVELAKVGALTLLAGRLLFARAGEAAHKGALA